MCERVCARARALVLHVASTGSNNRATDTTTTATAAVPTKGIKKTSSSSTEKPKTITLVHRTQNDSLGLERQQALHVCLLFMQRGLQAEHTILSAAQLRRTWGVKEGLGSWPF